VTTAMSDRIPGRNTNGGEAGFTLLELLIATTVLAFLSLLLFGGLRFGTRVWEKSEIGTTQTNKIRAAQLFLSGQAARIYPFFVGQNAPGKHVDFSGEERRMTYFAPSESVRGALDLVTVQAVPDRNGISVVVARKVELEGTNARISHHTLISGLKWFQISYYGPPAGAVQTSVTNKAGLGASAAAAAAAAPEWTSVWEGQPRLPLLIRIRAATQGKNAWPDLVMSPQTEVDESCVLDQTTNYCQGR